MTRDQLKKLIQESITDQLSKLKERADSNKRMQAEAICKIMQEQADALTSVIEHSSKLFNETQYAELNTHKTTLEGLRDQKLAKIKMVRERFGLDKKKDEKKKDVKKKEVDRKTGMKKPVKEIAKEKKK